MLFPSLFFKLFCSPFHSVIEHHKNGGNADDIEAMYDELQKESFDEENLIPQRPPRKKTTVFFDDSDPESPQHRVL